MTQSSPLPWTIDAQSLPASSKAFSYSATDAELKALASYADVAEVNSFTSEVRVRVLPGGRYRVEGSLRALIVQESVINLSPISKEIEEALSVEYLPEDTEKAGEEDSASLDADPPEALENGQIPIGKLLGELFAVAIDPYPRNENDTFEWVEKDSGADTGPFAALKALKPANDGG